MTLKLIKVLKGRKLKVSFLFQLLVFSYCSYVNALSNFMDNDVYNGPNLTFPEVMGNTSAAISQLKTKNTRDLFVGRKQAANKTFSLSLMKMNRRNSNNYNMTEVRSVFDTSNLPRIHGNQFRISTAYDPYVEWYKGRHWVAFECHGPDFNSLKTRMGLKHSSVGVCFGPLDNNHRLIATETRVLIAGGSPLNSDITLSASVPKLLVEKGRLYFYWTSVKQNNTSSYLSTRMRDSKFYRYKKQCLNTTNLNNVPCHYKNLLKENGRNLVPISYNEYQQMNCKLSPNNVCPTRSSFFSWQANTLSALDPYHYWIINSNSVTQGNLKRFPNELRFVNLETFGTEILFNSRDVPYLQQGSGKYHSIALAHERSSFQKILGVTSVSSNASQSRVADMFDIKKYNGRFYFAVVVGGIKTTGEDYERDYHCTSAVVGISDIGCYRFTMFSGTSPLMNARAGRQEELDLFYVGRPDLQPGASYTRFFINPFNDKTYVSAKFQGLSNGQEQTKLLELRNSIGKHYNTDTLQEGESLARGMSLTSADSKYSLIVNNNGWSIRNNHTKRIVYNVQRSAAVHTAKLILQRDGHLVYYPRSGSRSNLWKTNKLTARPTILKMQNDGNLVQYYKAANGKYYPLWQSGTKGR